MFLWRVRERGGRFVPQVQEVKGGAWSELPAYRKGLASREAALEVVRQYIGAWGGTLLDEEKEYSPSAKELERFRFMRWLIERGAFNDDLSGTNLTIREVLNGQL